MTDLPELGDPTLDADHRKLAALIAQVEGAPAESVLVRLDRLYAHAREHFALEDEELHMMRDGNASCHLDEHAAVLRSIHEVRDLMAADSASPVSRKLLARLVAELLRWLPEHVLAMDAGVANSRIRKRLGGSPIVITRRSSTPSE